MPPTIRLSTVMLIRADIPGAPKSAPTMFYPPSSLVSTRGGVQNHVSILALRPDISVKTALGNTPVKHKKRRFHDLSVGA